VLGSHGKASWGENLHAAVYYGLRDLRFESVAEPKADPRDVKLRIFYNGICGSDPHK